MPLRQLKHSRIFYQSGVGSRYLDACDFDGCAKANRKRPTWRLITFGRGAGTVGGDLTHAPAVAAQSHQAGDDGRLAVADAAHHHGALTLFALRGLQRFLQLLEQPVTADEHRVCGDAGHLEEQRLQHDVHWLVGSETRWREANKRGVSWYFLLSEGEELV